VYVHTGKIIDMIYKSGFIISKLKMSRFGPSQASRFLSIAGTKNNADNQTFLQSDVSIGLEIVAADALQSWKKLIGPENALQAKSEAPSSIRALYGTDSIRNAIHGSDNFQ
jgi:nucleoside-diphosphate kinase